MFFLKKRQMRERVNRWSLQTPLLHLTDHDQWTIGDAFMGTSILGSTGSGKTTGSMEAILRAFMQAGFGGTLLTTKPSDTAYYLRLCEATGRSSDVLVVSPGGPYRFNALEAELRRFDLGAGQTQSIVSLLTTMLEITQRGSGHSGEDSSYWQKTNQQVVRNATDILVAANDHITTLDLYKLILSAPTSYEQLQSEAWRRGSYLCQCLEKGDKKELGPIRRHDLNLAADFFLIEWPGLADRTRSVIVSVVSSTLDVMNRGVVRELTCSTSNIFPEMMQDGAIIIYDLPVKIYGDSGTLVQVQWKYCVQRAQERQTVTDSTRPVFLAADESHLFAVAEDQIFQTTARSSRSAVVYSTQSISNYLSAFGESREATVHSLLGNLQSQFFHQQTDTKTNQYAADLIGRSRQYVFNSSSTANNSAWLERLAGFSNPNITTGMSEIFEYEVQPQEFSKLRRGGPPEWMVDAILVQGGRRFANTNSPYTHVSFRQHIKDMKS